MNSANHGTPEIMRMDVRKCTGFNPSPDDTMPP